MDAPHSFSSALSRWRKWFLNLSASIPASEHATKKARSLSNKNHIAALCLALSGASHVQSFMNSMIASAYGPSFTMPFAANFDSGWGSPVMARGFRDTRIKSSSGCKGRWLINWPTLAIWIITTVNDITLSDGTLSVIDRW